IARRAGGNEIGERRHEEVIAKINHRGTEAQRRAGGYGETGTRRHGETLHVRASPRPILFFPLCLRVSVVFERSLCRTINHRGTEAQRRAGGYGETGTRRHGETLHVRASPRPILFFPLCLRVSVVFERSLCRTVNHRGTEAQ